MVGDVVGQKSPCQNDIKVSTSDWKRDSTPCGQQQLAFYAQVLQALKWYVGISRKVKWYVGILDGLLSVYRVKQHIEEILSLTTLMLLIVMIPIVALALIVRVIHIHKRTVGSKFRKINSIEYELGKLYSIHGGKEDSIKQSNFIGLPIEQFREFYSENLMTRNKVLQTTTELLSLHQHLHKRCSSNYPVAKDGSAADQALSKVNMMCRGSIMQHEDRKRQSQEDSLTALQTSDVRKKTAKDGSLQSPDRHALEFEATLDKAGINELQDKWTCHELPRKPIWIDDCYRSGGEIKRMWMESQPKHISRMAVRNSICAPPFRDIQVDTVAQANSNIIPSNAIPLKSDFKAKVLNDEVRVRNHNEKKFRGLTTSLANRECVRPVIYVNPLDEDADDEQPTDQLSQTKCTTKSRATPMYRMTTVYYPHNRPRAKPDEYNIVKPLTISLSAARAERTGYSGSESNSNSSDEMTGPHLRPIKEKRNLRLLRATHEYNVRQGKLDFEEYLEVQQQYETSAFASNS